MIPCIGLICILSCFDLFIGAAAIYQSGLFAFAAELPDSYLQSYIVGQVKICRSSFIDRSDAHRAHKCLAPRTIAGVYMCLVLCTKTWGNNVSFHSLWKLNVFLNDLHNFIARTSWYTNEDHWPQIFATKYKPNNLEKGACLRRVGDQRRGNCIIVAKMQGILSEFQYFTFCLI